ncbi:hypothetical protein ACF3NF_07855 (plasmid) [Anaerococcus martiniensis]|uniref:hypothetical protein n=1 Tax=Anaerococcus sp. WGS1579 TaxID=3366809 RepID=UPI00372D6A72
MGEKQNRTKKIYARLTEKEFEELEKKINDSRYNRSDYIRKKLEVEDKVLEEKIDESIKRDEEIREFIKNYDLSEEKLIKLSNSLDDLKVEVNNVGNLIRLYNPYLEVGEDFYKTDKLYLSYKGLVDELKNIANEVSILWELQKY